MNLKSLFTKEIATVKRVYLDYGAATPLHDEVKKAMEPWLQGNFANASAIHGEGVVVREAIENAREALAQVLHVRASGVVFTSGGTESNQLAVVGTIEAARAAGRAYSDMRVITTKIEHPSLLGVCDAFQKLGVDIAYAAVTEDGLIDEEHLDSLINDKTILLTYAYVNSEIGVVQRVKRISKMVKAYNTLHGTTVLSHIDASQAPLWLPCSLDQLGVDMITLDAGKCYGPKGVGVLAYRHGVEPRSPYAGGGQEGGFRSGTENISGIMGGVCALLRAQTSWSKRSVQIQKLRDRMMHALRALPGTVLNGSEEYRVANNVNISIPGIDGEFAVITLDAHGVAASTKSACASGKGGASPVVLELTRDEVRADGTIRFTLGEETTSEDIDYAVTMLKEWVLQGVNVPSVDSLTSI